MMKVLLIDNLILKTYLADVSIGCSNPHLALRRIGASNRNVGKISFQDQVVYQENLHHFMSTGATEKPKSQQG